MLPMCEPQLLDKQFRSIRGPLKVEVADKLSWRNALRKKSVSSSKSETIQNTTMEFEIKSGSEWKGIMMTYQSGRKIVIYLSADEKTRLRTSKKQLLKFCTKTLAEKIRMLFREQGITIASIPFIGMAIGVLVKVWLPSGRGSAAGSAVCKPPPEVEKGE